MSVTPVERIQRAYSLIKQAQRELDEVERAEVTVFMLADVGCIQCKLSLASVRTARLIGSLPAAQEADHA